MVDLNLFQIIGSYKSYVNVVTEGERYEIKHTEKFSRNYQHWVSDIKGVLKTFVVFIDNPAKSPKDCVYYIKVFEVPVVGSC